MMLISHQSLQATAGPVPQPPAQAPEQAAQPSRWSTLPIQLLHQILMYLPRQPDVCLLVPGHEGGEQ